MVLEAMGHSTLFAVNVHVPDRVKSPLRGSMLREGTHEDCRDRDSRCGFAVFWCCPRRRLVGCSSSLDETLASKAAMMRSGKAMIGFMVMNLRNLCLHEPY